MFKPVDQLNLFASPLLRYAVDNANELNARLLADTEALMRESPGLHRSNQRGWHSETDLFTRPEESFRRLTGIILRATAEATKRVAPRFDAALYRFAAQGWINVNGPGAYNTPHDHPGFCWSGVYYVSTPASDSPRAGNIEFLDPRTNVSDMAPPEFDYLAPKFQFRPEAGMILLFPSYLRHWVYPNESNEQRVSVAFNLRYTRKPPTEAPAA